MTLGDDLKEGGCCLTGKREVAQLINEQEPRARVKAHYPSPSAPRGWRLVAAGRQGCRVGLGVATVRRFDQRVDVELSGLNIPLFVGNGQ